MKLKNLYYALIKQYSFREFWKDFFVTHNGVGVFSCHSHINQHTGRPKVIFPTIEAAQKAAKSLSKKNGGNMAAYKCIYCDGFHIGHNR